jgi:succinate-acetate transporter protein
MTTSHQEPPVRRGARERTYRYEGNQAGEDLGAGAASGEPWQDRTRIVLTPVAAPSVLGLFGFFAATLLVGSNMAHWWGTSSSARDVFPYAVMLGGVAQFLAGMWAYRARDGLATAMHGIWGSFWLAFGLYQLLAATGTLPAVTSPLDPAFGFWFIPLAAITGVGALAALARSIGLFAVLGPLAAGCVFAAAGWIGGYGWCLTVAGWLFVFAAGFAFYAASAMMLAAAYGRTVLPTGELSTAANVPGRAPQEPIEYAGGMPGSRAGQ